jgi:hypothetical protein
MLICSERKILLTGCWWFVCSESKVLLDKPNEQGDKQGDRRTALNFMDTSDQLLICNSF